MPTITIRCLPTIRPRFLSTTARLASRRPREGTTGVFNDPASSKAAEETRPMGSQQDRVLTDEIRSRKFDRMSEANEGQGESSTFSKEERVGERGDGKPTKTGGRKGGGFVMVDQ